jgi:hypothetical protein
MNKKDVIKAFFLDKGYDLRKTKGFSDDAEVILRALNKNDALSALELYYRLEITVLGGDVLCLHDDGTIDYTHDSWHCDRYIGENEKQFFLRSIESSRDYINKYNPSFIDSSSILFDIVTNFQDVQ